MNEKPITFMLVYSPYNLESVNTRYAIRSFKERVGVHCPVNFQEINYEREKWPQWKYGIRSVPMTLVFIGDELVNAFYGEKSSRDYLALYQGLHK